MKNALIILSCGLLFSISAEAQKKKAPKPISVPAAVSTSFEGKFANAEKKSWKKGYNGNYVATFTNEAKQKQVAEFDASGNMVRSKTEIETGAVPENINTSVSAQYADSKVKEIAKVELAGIPSYYKVKIEQADNTTKEILISEEGTITE